MDSRDLIVIGLVGVGAWLAWRWYSGQAVNNAQLTRPDALAGANASGMTESAARSTVFGGDLFMRSLLAPVVSNVAQPKLPAPTAPAAAVAATIERTFPTFQRKANTAAFAPQLLAPTNDGKTYIATGITGFEGSAPAGDQPNPGDPSPFTVLQTRGVIL